MAPPKGKFAAASKAMKSIGIPWQTAKPVLLNLLGVYDSNWQYIEAENYRVLADAILDAQESKDEKPAKKTKYDGEFIRKNVELAIAERKQSTTGIMMGSEESYRHNSAMVGAKKLKTEDDVSWSSPDVSNKSKQLAPSPPQAAGRKMTTSTGAHWTGLSDEHRRDNSSELGSMVHYGEVKTEPGALRERRAGGQCIASAELLGAETLTSEAPLALITYPDCHDATTSESTCRRNAPERSMECQRKDIDERGTVVAEKKRQIPSEVSDNRSTLEDSLTCVEIASSSSGTVKLSLTCSASMLTSPGFHLPSIESICKIVEDRCVMSYKISKPDFSLLDLLKEMCQCLQELGSESEDVGQENVMHIMPALDPLNKTGTQQVLSSSNGVPNVRLSEATGAVGLRDSYLNSDVCGSNVKSGGEKPLESFESNSCSLMVVSQPQPQPHFHDINDIAKGEERVRISIVNEVSTEKWPPPFNYIPCNAPYQSAYINLSLARIGDADCCSDCFGDCLASSLPCACARETGGEFAYTGDGLLKKEFLDECNLLLSEPQKHHYFYCQDCPLERAKNDSMPEQCKGHLIRKFIKECWSKCGCNKQCGNRVVQRGITCNIQVFLTPEGKGWGLRSLDELPRGAFICEYVGEIMTNIELHDRTIWTTGNAKHTYPVLLDADWGTEIVLKDEEALCLDATFYGNVARFINHRCGDANLIGIPVEVETPDHHYYHLSFFTRWKVEPFEELTWDYEIDFSDDKHPIKAFKCLCGSKHCRDVNV